MIDHHIVNQDGMFIHDEAIRNEINHAIDKDMEHTYFEGHRIDIVQDKKYPNERVTLVDIEFPPTIQEKDKK